MRFYARAACETLVSKTREQPAVLRGSVLPPGARKPLNDHNPDTPASARAWLSVVILLVVAILSYLDRQVIALMVEPIQASLKVSDFEIGLLQRVAFGLFYAIFGIPMGWLVDRYSRRKIIYFGMTCWSIAAAACGLANSYWQLLLARFGVGIGEASLSPAAYSIISDLRSEEHTSELQSLMRISSAVFCLQKKNKTTNTHSQITTIFTTLL